MDEGRRQVRGVELAYDVAGEGRNVVWGHGLTSSRAGEADLPILDPTRLRGVARVLRYDARGHGTSGWTEDFNDYSWQAMGLDQLELAAVLGMDRYVAAGASMGTGTALHAAVAAPERIEAMVLAVPPTAWETRRSQTELYAAMADAVEEHGVAALAPGTDTSFPIPDPFVGRDDWMAGGDLFADADPRALARVFRGAGTADLPEPHEIARLTQPTLLLAWTGDPGHPVSTAERLLDLLPAAELHLASTWDELQTWSDLAVAFVSDL